MPGRVTSRGPRCSIVALMVVYGLVVFAGSFLDHDFACHQNSRTHCPFCHISQGGQKVDIGGSGLETPRRVVGRIELQAAFAVRTPAASGISDRAPPA